MLNNVITQPKQMPRPRLGGRHRRRREAQYLVWAPRESAVRIEYSSEVLREAARAEKGVLYGKRDGATFRVTAARREQPVEGDPRLASLDLLGTFASRPRGEIFLTDSDIEHLELTGGSIALVMAGTNAGFFVYEPDGAIQTIKSYREFSFADPPAKEKLLAFPKQRIALACVAVFACALALGEFLRTPPLALAVHEDAGQLLICWNRNTFAAPARLEISDGSWHDWIPVYSDLSSATYVRRTTDVQVRLIAGRRSETAHFVAAGPSPALREDVERLESEASALRAQLEAGQSRIALLQTRITRQLK